MPEITTSVIKDYLSLIQGREITLANLRKEFNILPGSRSFDAVRNILFQLAEQKIVRPTGKRDGSYKVITQVKPVQVFGTVRERRPPFPLIFPKNYDTKMEMDFAEYVVIREGDLILISGVSNFGKTALCINICGENIDKGPVLMGNEYTTIDNEPSPRFLNRLDAMNWIQWTNGNGMDKFTLLPVHDDYAEHIVKDKINIIDWINLPGEYYMISPLMENIKRALGRGIGIVVLQKNEGAFAGRGGAPSKDFADCELLLDRFGDSGVLLTVGKIKEYTQRVIGRTYAYSIGSGVKILDFREVTTCRHCHATGYVKGGKCDVCLGTKYINS